MAGFAMLYRTVYAILGLALSLAICGCAAGASPAQPPAFNVAGIWQGETRVVPCGFPYSAVERCNAVNRITFMIQQQGSELRGGYKCAIGNAVCRDANRTTEGTIVRGTVSGRTIALRVFLPGDVSSCMYNGQLTSATQARGGYRCYQGGGLIEQGLWQVSRDAASSEMPAASR